MPIKNISNSEIVAGFLFFKTTFQIQGKPIEEAGLTVLVVDGEKLFKSDKLGRPLRSAKVPGMKKIRELIDMELTLLSVGIKNKDFTKYINYSSKIFQSKFDNKKIIC